MKKRFKFDAMAFLVVFCAIVGTAVMILGFGASIQFLVNLMR
jgi:hypothetical protein